MYIIFFNREMSPSQIFEKKIVFIMGFEYLTTNLEEIINALQHSILSIDFIF